MAQIKHSPTYQTCRRRRRCRRRDHPPPPRPWHCPCSCSSLGALRALPPDALRTFWYAYGRQEVSCAVRVSASATWSCIPFMAALALQRLLRRSSLVALRPLRRLGCFQRLLLATFRLLVWWCVTESSTNGVLRPLLSTGKHSRHSN